MIRYPKIFIDKFKLSEEYIEKDFSVEDILETFNGKNSIEDIYGFFLSENYSLEKINNLFQTLIKNELIQDKINFESLVLTAEELETYSDQIKTLSLFNQSYEESQYLNLLSGLKCQEKICQSELILFGNSILKHDVSGKCEQVGIKKIITWNNLQETTTKADALIYLPKNYDENELIDILRFCNGKQIAFFPVIQTNYGVEFGPFYLPNDSSCSLCLINRKKSVLGENYESNIKDPLNLNFSLGTDLILVEILKFITGIAPITMRNKVLQYNIISGALTYHPVLKIPNCEICNQNNLKPKRRLWDGLV